MVYVKFFSHVILKRNNNSYVVVVFNIAFFCFGITKDKTTSKYKGHETTKVGLLSTKKSPST